MKKYIAIALSLIMIAVAGTGCTNCDNSPSNPGTSVATELSPQTESPADANVRDTLSREGYTLKQVVVLSRHNIRAPLSTEGSALNNITPHKWFEWSSQVSQLSVRGGILETEMGQFFRKWLENEGVFEQNYHPNENAVRIYANSKQRTISTARFFSAGLLPVDNKAVEYHTKFDTMDPVFNPVLTFATDKYAQEAGREIHRQFDPVIGALNDNYQLIEDVIDIKSSDDYKNGKYSGFSTRDSEFIFKEGEEPALTGSLKLACQISDALILQYYEEPDTKKAAFGHDLSEKDWQEIAEIKDVYEDALFKTPLVAANVAHPLLKEMKEEMSMEGRQFTFLCGHDSNLVSVLSALGVEDYALPGSIEKKTPIGAKLVFSKWTDNAGEEYISLDLVYQNTDQLREMPILDLKNPPAIYNLKLKGLEAGENGMYRASEVMDRFSSAINDFIQIKKEYAS